MGIILSIYIVTILVLFLFSFVFHIIENKIPETHTFKKWWRKHVVGNDTEG